MKPDTDTHHPAWARKLSNGWHVLLLKDTGTRIVSFVVCCAGKLAAFAKGRIKYEDFTSKDKFNILDLFVNNQKTLIKIYEALFPHRVSGNTRSPSGLTSPSNEKISTGRYGYISGVDSST